MDQAVLRIEGPLCRASCFGDDVEFPVFSAQTGEQVGLITKQWAGFVQEVKKNDKFYLHFTKMLFSVCQVYTAADNYRISFPLDLDVKVTLLN